MNDESDLEFTRKMDSVAGLQELIKLHKLEGGDEEFFKELVLHGLAETEVLSKNLVESRIQFSDPLASMFDEFDEETD